MQRCCCGRKRECVFFGVCGGVEVEGEGADGLLVEFVGEGFGGGVGLGFG